ncbi:phosphate signaling complex protein PhoU [Paraliomyxa miuraensis]|uniref:phosphate signaling complex protein PhoU n=1 Tax=Paraliomyxa miuraensis TaxID=376150 RepID=UPI00224E779D|nr:phosphate signaling complex protein PhoU [Paraliomyxa miuraensis]MCX4242622.1 phosphate signaling complex protein PhoU [Paraliomyxa miuraensis]
MPDQSHTDRAYEHELHTVRVSLLRMAGRVEHMIGQAGRALVERDAQLAQKVIAEDQEVNRAEVEIDELCLRILAKRQPMASDLRFVTLAMKMVTDLERIADLAVNICERAVQLCDTKVVVHAEIPEMCSAVEGMVRDSIDAFVNRDVAKARAVIVRDDVVDQYYHRIFEDLLRRMQHEPALLHEWIHVQSVAKWLERMGDHSTNLAELVVFMIEGRDIRHPRLHGDRKHGY